MCGVFFKNKTVVSSWPAVVSLDWNGMTHGGLKFNLLIVNIGWHSEEVGRAHVIATIH